MTGSPFVLAYERAFPLPLPPDGVWSVLERLDCFEAWWAWLTEFRVDGPGLAPGSVLQGTVAPPWPYRLRVRVELLDCVRPRLIDAAVHGDLEGRARLGFEADGDGSRVNVSSNIEVVQRPLRAAARVAPGLLRWGHDRVVDSTVRSFRTRLGEGS